MDVTTRERLISLSDVPKLPWLNKRIHLATVYRWAQRGINGHRLQVVQAGGGKATTERWVWDFFEKLTNGTPAAERSPSKRKREIERANRELAEAGF